MSGDEAFNIFEEEFASILSSLDRKIKAIARDPPAQRALVDEAEADIYDANTSLQNIEQDVRHYPYHLKSKAQARLKTLKAQFDDQVNQLKAAKEGPSDVSRADRAHRHEQRQRLLGAQVTMRETGDSLDRTTAALEQTVAVGAETSITLQEQRETLVRARETIRETDDFLTRTSNTLRRMRRRLMTNKLISWIIIVVELAIIALIVWLKWLK